MTGDSTLAGLEDESGGHPWSARVCLTVLLAVVLAGAAGGLGVHTADVSSSGHGYSLSLSYPRVARAGLDVTWQVTVRHEGGFGAPIVLAVTGDYFGIFETQGFFPEPDAERRSADTLYLSFTAPPGDTLVVDYDAYIQPSSQVGRDGAVSVVSGGETLASVDFSTWLFP